MENKSFFQIMEVANKKLNLNESFISLEDQWASFIDVIKSGYTLSFFDYSNDLSIRDIIEKYLNNDELKKFEAYQSFRSHIESMDNKFIELCNEHLEIKVNERWWNNLIPDDLKNVWSNPVNLHRSREDWRLK